jgi:transcriptional regulator with XRE-family HTH domain
MPFHPVDVEVGRRIRIRRQQLGLTQTDLANGLGYTFQQVQKYEKGTNRVSCSKLVEIAAVLKCSTGSLLPGDGGKKANEQTVLVNAIGGDRGTLELVEAFNGIDAKLMRRRVVDLVEAISNGTRK